MVYSLEELVRLTRISMKEDIARTGEDFDEGGLSLDTIIASVMAESVESVVQSTLFTGHDDLQKLDGQLTISGGRGYLELPEDYWRLVNLRLTGWQHDVTEEILPGDERYYDRLSISSLRRGNVYAPRAYQIGGAAGNQLELYPCDKGWHVEYGKYISRPVLTGEGKYFLSDRLLPYVTAEAARRAGAILNF